MAVSDKVSKTIWGQCAARCCICKKSLIKENKKLTLIGEVAHIVGSKAGAARGMSSLTQQERDEVDNLMLLCLEHHKEIDDNEEEYSVEHLKSIKKQHLQWIADNLIQEKVWKLKFSIFFYLNVPRLSEQAARLGQKIDLSHFKSNSSLHSLGWELNNVIFSFKNALQQLEINSIPIDEVILHESLVGRIISFEQKRFRTKNIDVDMRNEQALMNTGFTGNWDKDPHIYIKMKDFKIVFSINPRWITTTTAFVHFRPSAGHNSFSGFGIITSVDYDNLIITATPFAIGQFDFFGQYLSSNS